MTSADQARRERHMDRLFAALIAEISGFAQPGLLNWMPAAERIADPDRELVRIAAAYERGEASQEAVLNAARTLRRAWREAAELYARSRPAAREHTP